MLKSQNWWQLNQNTKQTEGKQLVSKGIGRNADFYEPVLNKITTTHE